MRIKHLAVAAAISIPVVPALAQQDVITGVYARSPEQCAVAQKDVQDLFDSGEMVRTADGFSAIEYNCQIVDWNARRFGPGGVAVMLCEEPGYAYPEIYAVMPRGEGELELTVPVSAAQSEDIQGNDGIWHLCEGVKMPGG